MEAMQSATQLKLIQETQTFFSPKRHRHSHRMVQHDDR